MALTLDDRQRAMLLEMGVRVWLPGTVFETEPPTVAVSTAQPAVAPQPAATVAPAAPAPAVPAPAPVRAVPVARAPAVVARAVGTPLDLGALDWAALADTAASCQACGLCAGRKHATLQPATGQRDWLVVGDPPEEDEDRAAQAFVESPGLLLDNMLKAVGASRSLDAQGATAAYATNVVKCRPPHGQIPQAADLAQCAQYLQREITLVQPKVILAMGRFAIQTLLAEHGALATQPLGKLRGTVYQYQGIPVIVTYHPKLLLRNSADKAKAWADLCLAMDVRDASVK